MKTLTVEVPAISCGHCVSTIERELSAISGVRRVSAEAKTRQLEIEWDDEVTSWDRIRGHLEEINYPPLERR